MERTRTRGRKSDTMIDWMKSNDVEYDHIKKRPHDREDRVIGGIDLPEKAEHSRERERDCSCSVFYSCLPTLK